jgi:Uma2 family endonuclease
MEIPAALFEPGLEIRLRHGSNGGFCDEAFEEFCRANPDLRIERNAHGEIIVMPPVGGESSHRNATVTGQLGGWAAKDGRGQAFDSSAAFHLPDGSIFSPDASWVPKQALRQLTPKQRKEFLPFCPEFVVEVRSPTDRLAECERKMEQWIVNGAHLGWLLDSDARTVYIYRRNRPPQTRRGIAELAGEGPVKGFVLQLVAIWRGLAL